MEKISIIAAMTPERVIGNRGMLPWTLPEDIRFFKETTYGNSVVMGRKTFESIGKPLKWRDNFVVSSSLSKGEGITVCRSLEEALIMASAKSKAFVIGGSKIYEQALQYADYMYLSMVDRSYNGDAYFPVWSKEDWDLLDRVKREGFSLETYRRIR